MDAVQLQQVFGTAVTRLAKPLARFCLHRSLKFQDLLTCLKRALVEVAREEIARDGSKESISKLSVMTGLQRPDIAQILAEPMQAPATSVLSRVIGKWYGSLKLQDSNGKPKILSCERRDSEFAKLVASVSKEVNPYAVMFDLQRLELAEKTATGLKLRSNVHVSTDIEAAVRLLAKDMSDLMTAVEENVFSQQEIRNLHIHVEYDNIRPEDLNELKQWMLEEGSKFAAAVQKKFAAFDQDINPQNKSSKAGSRIALGIFGITEEKKTQ